MVTIEWIGMDMVLWIEIAMDVSRKATHHASEQIRDQLNSGFCMHYIFYCFKRARDKAP